MKPAKQVKKYAKTLIGVVGLDETPKALSELSALEEIMSKSSEFKSFLVSPGFSKTERGEVLRQVSSKIGLSDKLTKFVVHMADVKVIGVLPEIIKAANALYLEKKKRARAIVMTPVAVGKGLEERLKTSLKKLIDRDVDLEYVMDPSLLGGILIKVGSTMYDSSVKGQLRLLKDELIKG